MNKTITLILALLFAFTAGAQNANNEDLDAKYASSLLQPGTEVPDILVDSTANLRLSDMRGHYVLLHFWASWCPDCRKDMPEMEAINKKYNVFDKLDELAFIHISFDGDTAKMYRYLNDHPLGGFNLCQDRKFHDSEIGRLFGLKWIPSMILVDPQGRVALSTVMVSKVKDALKHLDTSKLDPNAPKALEMPEYNGGVNALVAFLRENIRYPKLCEKMGLESKVRLAFTVDGLGQITNLRIKENNLSTIRKAPISKFDPEECERLTKECATLFANEAKRVVSIMPAWKPGRQFGKEARVRYVLPVTFKLE